MLTAQRKNQSRVAFNESTEDGPIDRKVDVCEATAGMGQSQWTAGSEKDRERKREKERSEERRGGEEERRRGEAFEIKSLSSSTRLIFPKVKY
ncbi:unnamed protein product [Pleuronectes platessa]|uniref:Uncharacterized protein n=1 Tax=Pleuronectes platessa TaxID=8262 RepID=A0A9N7YW80_PLEPL|nr:unnamed protein product [Pleuronectes platessa]